MDHPLKESVEAQRIRFLKEELSTVKERAEKAEARVKELEAQERALEADLNSSVKLHASALRIAASLEADLKAAREDSARLDWLLTNYMQFYVADVANLPLARERIDAARQQQSAAQQGEKGER